MLTTRNIFKAARHGKLGYNKYPRNQRYSEAVMNSISDSVEYLSYVGLNGAIQTLPVSSEDMAFIKRESDVPTFYARTCASGERLVIVYDSKSIDHAKEIAIDVPLKLRSKKCYFTKELQSPVESLDESRSDPVFQNLKNFYDNIQNMPRPSDY